MVEFVFFIAFIIVAVSTAQTMDSNKNDLVNPQKSMMAPKKSENRLTEEQKLQLHGIAENNSATKKQILDNLKLFINKNRIRENASVSFLSLFKIHSIQITISSQNLLKKILK